jgi:hypothetical protein
VVLNNSSPTKFTFLENITGFSLPCRQENEKPYLKKSLSRPFDQNKTPSSDKRTPAFQMGFFDSSLQKIRLWLV